MRIAVVDYDLCNPSKCSLECMKVCPINMKGKECVKLIKVPIAGEMKDRAYIDESLCIGCGLCVKACPFGAIKIVNTPESLDETPVHRYGPNGFVLFRLPVPKNGVVGILGENGLGKSTAMKILAGELKPNLGGEAGWDEIIRLHRGSELQPYFERLSRGEVRAVYKPQRVDAVRRVMGERGVAELLERIDGKIAEALSISHLSDRKVSQLSGGELQRLMIAAALSRDADLYLIDEPTSYLDIRQRMEMAKAVREKAGESMVMVIEHDLATLDFLADYIHIFYGEPSAFGIVSKPYSVRNGINAFIEGYIREDNVRIHGGIKFRPVVRQSEERKEVLARVDGVEIRYESFTLHAEPFEVFRSEIIGMVGENALGKSSLMKKLAGMDLSISYKPQFIEPSEGTVEEFVGHFSQAHDVAILSPLSIKPLMRKRMEDLSGGELQRVVTAKALMEDADIYLLDEPCAFLDVRQRLALARVVMDLSPGKAFFIIDHDLMFISHISDRLMLFTGVPGREGHARLLGLEQGLNEFLRSVGITFRMDRQTKRPRANKPGSQKDEEQRKKGVYYEV